MKQCGTIFFGVSLLLCAVLQRTFAAKGHWNPKSPGGPAYHPYSYPIRNKELIKEKIDFQGWTFAGRSEFPWLVDIRTNDSEDFTKQEDWANGNLVTCRFVLTVCIVVANFKPYDAGPYSQDPSYKDRYVFLSPKNPKYVKVLFSDDYTYKSVENGYYTGTRQVRRLIPHPKCNSLEMDFQWGMIELKKPIWAVPPYTSYMPMNFVDPDENGGYNDLKEKYVRNKVDREASAPCVVGLWSRKANTVVKDRKGNEEITIVYDNDQLLNYKVRYTVFPTDPADCFIKSQKLFPIRLGIGTPIWAYECMAVNTNETLGMVCDRDKGAPIVCGGIVRALVVTGALEPFCNITQPVPFLVIQVKYAYGIFSDTNRDAWDYKHLHDFMRLPDKPIEYTAQEK